MSNKVPQFNSFYRESEKEDILGGLEAYASRNETNIYAGEQNGPGGMGWMNYTVREFWEYLVGYYDDVLMDGDDIEKDDEEKYEEFVNTVLSGKVVKFQGTDENYDTVYYAVCLNKKIARDVVTNIYNQSLQSLNSLQ